MFSRLFNTENLTDFLSGGPPSTGEVEEILDKKPRGIRDIARLLLAQGEARSRVFDRAVSQRTESWQGRLFLVPPLYISDGDPKAGGCLGDCMYCGWRRPSDGSRRKTTRMWPDEIEGEVKILVGSGYGDVELVAATDSVLFDSSRCAEYVVAAKKAGARNVGINFFPLSSPRDYEILGQSGVSFSVVWQEAYSRSAYRDAHHLGGAKFNYEYRLDAHDRAAQGGIRTVGVAFLGGLSDWRFEALAAVVHARYLQSEYGVNIIFGMPRWKAVPGVDFIPTDYSDGDYALVGSVYSLAVPEALPWFSTREDFELSAEAAKGGGCLFTLDCSTKVGGYSSPNGVEQFPVNSYGFKSGTSRLLELGFMPEIHLPW